MKAIYRVAMEDPLKKVEFTKFSALTKRQEEIVRAINPKILTEV
jgi:hypothetical protein